MDSYNSLGSGKGDMTPIFVMIHIPSQCCRLSSLYASSVNTKYGCTNYFRQLPGSLPLLICGFKERFLVNNKLEMKTFIGPMQVVTSVIYLLLGK